MLYLLEERGHHCLVEVALVPQSKRRGTPQICKSYVRQQTRLWYETSVFNQTYLQTRDLTYWVSKIDWPPQYIPLTSEITTVLNRQTVEGNRIPVRRLKCEDICREEAMKKGTKFRTLLLLKLRILKMKLDKAERLNKVYRSLPMLA